MAGVAGGAFDGLFQDGMARLASHVARLRALASGLPPSDAGALLTLLRDAQAGLLLLRARSAGDLPAAAMAREAGRLCLTLDPARLARLPQPARLVAVEAQLLAGRIGARLMADATEPGKNEKPRRRPSRPRLHVVPPAP